MLSNTDEESLRRQLNTAVRSKHYTQQHPSKILAKSELQNSAMLEFIGKSHIETSYSVGSMPNFSINFLGLDTSSNCHIYISNTQSSECRNNPQKDVNTRKTGNETRL